jgi:putative ABC transport system substrate-binding protein
MPAIGWLSVGSPRTDEPFRLPAFRRGLSETGYDEGRNVAIEYGWAEGEYNRLPTLAADLVRRQVAAIVTPGAPSAFASKAATSTIPIVFNQGVDPVQSGLVTSFNRPGGNITGVAVLTAELAGKRLEMLHELHPTAPVLALLVHPTNPVTASEIKNFEDAARSIGLQTYIARASTPSEINDAFKSLVERGAAGLVVSGDPFFTNRLDQIVGLAALHAVLAVYVYRGFPLAGGLMSYGPDLADSYRLVGLYTGKILNGVRPSDLPVE